MNRLKHIWAITVIVLSVGAGCALFTWATIADVAQQREASYQGTAVHGMPQPWQFNFPVGQSPIQEELYALHNLLFVINLAICALVAVLLLYVAWRFRSGRHSVPSSTTHNVPLEITWTVLPVVILVIIAIPSAEALYRTETIPEADVTLKVTGRQWYWDYEYPDLGNIRISSNVLAGRDLPQEERAMRLLATDNFVILPTATVIRIQMTSSDVVHSFAVPSLGIKRDAVPGRLSEAWTKIAREGLYFGQCSELCGQGHAYMPIAIKAVSPDAFDEWVERTRAAIAAPTPAPNETPAPATDTQGQ